ncbi:MAG: DUF1854 domain-containing protein [Burkholderiales bacterium]|nr:DUF1854 domain-containing protein [Phycisphaerae bacterium]
MQMSFTLSENIDHTLTLHRPGQDDVADVRLRRSFPWTKANELVSVRDEKGKEQALIERLSDLPAAQRAIVDRWLAANSFIPIILRVESVNVDFGYQQWGVQSDRGPLRFRVQEREDIRFLPDGRFSIKDVEGNVYAMPRLEELDPQSRRAVEALL